ncbi:GIY-YIG nuclease family protein [Salisediminibacterium selenitireducens]|nr:GIY-YIG nuclease family protein [Salisediminibacterium selenitireducens]
MIDGNPNGRMKCTLANWTGLAYRIPRKTIEESQNREELHQTGVYFLFGADEETGESVVYIGQAGVRKNGEGILNRLKEHKRDVDKGYWTEAVLFTTSNNSFGPTEISYLESRFCDVAKQANRYIVKNGNEPNLGNITEEKQTEMEEFIDNARIIMGAMGHKLFEELTTKCETSDTSEETTNPIFYLKRNTRKSNTEVDAKCEQTNEGFVVLKGSRIEMIDSNSLPPAVKRWRENAKVDNDGLLQENVLCSSPTYAAAFVVGGITSGPDSWKNAEGKTLKEIEKAG